MTPDGISHPLTLRRATLNPGESDNYPNVIKYVIRAQDLQLDPGSGISILKATATTEGVIHQNIVDSAGKAFQSLNTYVVEPCIAITRECAAQANGTIAVSGTVRNYGTVPLTNVLVVNIVWGVSIAVLGPTVLAINETRTYSTSYTPSAVCEPSTGRTVATGRDYVVLGSNITTPQSVSAEASSTCQLTVTPGIAVDHDCPLLAPQVNGSFAFRSTVRNTGNIALNNIVVANNGTTVTTIASLAPGASAAVNNSLPAAGCSINSTLTAVGTSACSQPVNATKSITCAALTSPALVVSHDCPSGGPIIPGIATAFGGSVRNTGNVTLDGVVVKQGDTILVGPVTLNPNESKTFSGSVTALTDNCTVTTTVSASGRDVCADKTVSSVSAKSCPVKSNPGIAISSECPAEVIAPGGNATAKTTVRNTGDSILNNVTVNSDRALGKVFGPVLLAPGASATFTHTFKASLVDCAVTEKLTATATDRCGVAVAAETSKTCFIVGEGRVAIGVRCGTAPVAPGGAVAFSGTVTNTGNVVLLDVTVKLSNGTVVKVIPSLEAGEKSNFEGTLQAPTGVCEVTVTVGASAADKCASVGTSSFAQ